MSRHLPCRLCRRDTLAMDVEEDGACRRCHMWEPDTTPLRTLAPASQALRGTGGAQGGVDGEDPRCALGAGCDGGAPC